MENEKLEKLTRIRIIIQVVSLVLVVAGSLVAILAGGFNFKGNEFKSIPFVVVGLVLFGIGILALAITEVYVVLKMKKENETEENK